MKLRKCLLELGFCGDGFLDNLYDSAALPMLQDLLSSVFLVVEPGKILFLI